jgi:hypothetical protein
MNDANDTNDPEDLSGLSDVHKTLSDAAEVIAAFIGAANSEEIPVGSLMEAADKTLANLVRWHSGLKGVLSQVGEQRH